MGIKRIVDTSFWTDGKVDDFTPEDKYFMLYLLTNPFTTQLGIYEISIKQAAFQLGYSIDAFNALLERFQNKYHMIVFSKSTNEIAILNFLRHSIIKGGKPVEDCLNKEIAKVKNKELIRIVFNFISDKDDLNDTVRKIINMYENDLENDNDNDNDNEVSYHDSYNDSLKNKKSKRFIKPSIDDIQNYCNERNNNVDANKFYNYYESVGWKVGKNPMKDWKAAIRTWERNNFDNNPKKGQDINITQFDVR